MSRARKEEMIKAAGGKWMKKAVKRPGALHRKLHVPLDEKIPTKKLDKALHSKNKLLREEAHFADVSKHSIHHKHGGRGG